jgi:hypothetical protein
MLFFLNLNAFAPPSNTPIEITEEDGSPSIYPYQIKFPNGSITDNGDGTLSYSGASTGLYLPLTGKAADADLLDGHDTAYFQVAGSYLTVETDPIVKAINGLVKSNGVTISAALAGTDYLASEVDPNAWLLTGDQANISGTKSGTFDLSSPLGTYTAKRFESDFENDTADLGEDEGDSAYLGLQYWGISASPSAYQGSVVHARARYGWGETVPVGTMHGVSSHMRVYTSGSNANEFCAYLSDSSVDAIGRIWGADFNLHGPAAVQSNLIVGFSNFLNNYNSGAIANGGYGEVITTYPGQGGGDLAGTRVNNTTYPLNSGIAIVGKSGTAASTESTATNGFNTALQIGGYAGGWMTSSFFSKFGTGIDLQDYKTYGLYIHGKSGGADTEVKSLYIADDSGTVDFANNQIRSTGTLGAAQSCATLNTWSFTTPNPVALRNMICNDFTSAGSANARQVGISSTVNAGYTGAHSTFVQYNANAAASTGNNLNSWLGNFGFANYVYGTTTGLNCGGLSWAQGGNLNIGMLGESPTAKNSATNLGVMGIALNTGTSPIQIGGYFTTRTPATPAIPSVSAALIADNGEQTTDVVNFMDNGTSAFKIADGGTASTQNVQPKTDDTYYLGKNDDDTPFAYKALILKDTSNGKYYRFEIINGVPTATDLTD